MESALRSLCAVEAGRPCTKSEGVFWALTHLPTRWHAVVRAAAAVRDGSATRIEELRVMAVPAGLFRSASRYSGASPTEG